MKGDVRLDGPCGMGFHAPTHLVVWGLSQTTDEEFLGIARGIRTASAQVYAAAKAKAGGAEPQAIDSSAIGPIIAAIVPLIIKLTGSKPNGDEGPVAT